MPRTAAGQSAHLPASKRARPAYQDLHAQVLQEVLTRLDRALHACFRRRKPGEQPGYPRCTWGTRSASCTAKQVGHGATLDTGVLVLATSGRVAVRWSRPLEGTPKTLTMRREADGWYVTCSCAEVPLPPVPLTDQHPGSDRGVASCATWAAGSQIATPRLVRVAARHLQRAQRRVSRRVKGSNRRHKAVTLLAKAHATVRRARADCHHTTALALVRQDDTRAQADVQPAHRLTHQHLAKRIAEAGWSACWSIRSCTAVAAGKTVVAVPAPDTAPACSGCGVLVHTGVSLRWHACPECGTSLQRDHNAARTILRLGTARSGAGQAPQALTQLVGAYGA